jgi:hypothetical protein
VQVQGVLGERLAVIGHIDHRDVESLAPHLEEGDRLREEGVGADDRVAAGVDDLRAAAVAQLVALADGRPHVRLGGAAPEMRRTVVVRLVQHHHRIAAGAAHHGLETVQQDLSTQRVIASSITTP